MNKQQLQEAINFLFEPNAVIGLELYLVLNTVDGAILRRANLGDAGLPEEVRNGFMEYINGRTIQNEDVLVKPLSELDPLRSTIHHYDLDGIPEELEILNIPLTTEDIPIFNFGNDSLENMDAFVIKLASVHNQIVLYKKHSHLNLLKQSRVFYFVKDAERFAKPQEGVLRFSFTIDFMKVNDQVLVYDINCLERQFKFSDIIKNNAREKVNLISGLGFVENIEELEELASDKAGAKKVLRIRPDSPVLSLTFNQVKTFVKNHPYLKRRLKFNDDESKFRFHTKVSRIYFIDLLNDNYLTSDLTSKYYKTNVKDEMTEGEGENEE